MNDMREGIAEAIENYEENGVKVELSQREKDLIEYGYIQYGLDLAFANSKKGSASEAFMGTLGGGHSFYLKKELLVKQSNSRKEDKS